MSNLPPNQNRVEGNLRTAAEANEAGLNRQCFERCPDPWEKKMENFPKYVRRQNLTRLLALYEIFKRTMSVKGSIVECGVFRGFGISSWAKFSAILEPVNFMRKIYGFDSFAGFPQVSKHDHASVTSGDLYSDSHEELNELMGIHDSTRFLGHMPKVQLIKGDATKTIPNFIEENPHVVVSLLFLDFDLFEPTKAALEAFVPRMPKGSIIAFDELDNKLWPGETMALLNTVGIRNLRLERLEFDPYIGFAVIE